MDKSVNCLLCEHEDLSNEFKSQHPRKCLGTLTHTCNPNTRELETGGSLPLLAS